MSKPLSYIKTSDREPGQVDWLAKINGVEVKLATSAEFGQVSSGTLSLTGPIGVLRLEKEGSQPPSSDDENIIHERRWVLTHWDTKELEERYGPSQYTGAWRYSTYGSSNRIKHVSNCLDVFYMPFRTMDFCEDGDDWEWPKFAALLLLPTGKKRGQYRRVGQLECLSRQGERAWSGSALKNKTKIQNPSFYVMEHKSGEYEITIV